MTETETEPDAEPALEPTLEPDRAPHPPAAAPAERNALVRDRKPGGNRMRPAWHRMRPVPPSPGRRETARVHEVRRLRDMIRTTIQRDGYPGGLLPHESELMAGHGMSRATVREALAMLRADGLIERTQGVGTHVVTATVTTGLAEAHGAVRPTANGLFDRRMRPRVLDRSRIPVPGTVAERLGVPLGTPCLRLEYVGLLDEEPLLVATNYALYPEAERLGDSPFVSDWYALMAAAGAAFGQSEFVIGSELADPLTADMLGLRPGAPLLAMEQVIYDPDGRPFDVAFIYTRSDRMRFMSRAVVDIPPPAGA
ncbi:GntR family transcriptional regulator [Streptomyces sp. NBC_00669]|uniref:GntR family transcriptional regulator n=1 Tax=Streptomyces sp. NBC_00669 TaxID=2976011 RepID=UPI002E3233A9|nr:GntR family transcriptional regulator [Streptomyces sp. NBC_00669]